MFVLGLLKKRLTRWRLRHIFGYHILFSAYGVCVRVYARVASLRMFTAYGDRLSGQ